MMLSQTFTVLAKTEEQLQQEKSQAQSQLSETNAVINSLSEKQTQVQAQINAMDGDMVDLMIQIDATKADIASTEESISQKETDIIDKTAEIEESKENLAEAEKDRDKQYQDMKKRIQYIYEHGGSEVSVSYTHLDVYKRQENDPYGYDARSYFSDSGSFGGDLFLWNSGALSYRIISGCLRFDRVYLAEADQKADNSRGFQRSSNGNFDGV